MWQKVKDHTKTDRFQIDLLRAGIAGIILLVIFSFLSFFASCGEISDNVLRLHVLANSDSDEDQAVKLEVRDAVLRESAKWYADAATFDEANSAICTHLESITNAAKQALEEQGVRADVTASVEDVYFTTRDYEDFTLPAGKYRTLQVTIGEGKGKNWWCMVYPSLCLPASEKANEDILATLPEHEGEIIGNPNEYQVKFKVVEWYEQLKSWFDGK